MRSTSCANFWTCLMFRPAHEKGQWTVANKMSWCLWLLSLCWYSSKKRSSLWCTRLRRYSESSFVSSLGCPHPISLALVTLPVRCLHLTPWARVEAENLTIKRNSGPKEAFGELPPWDYPWSCAHWDMSQRGDLWVQILTHCGGWEHSCCIWRKWLQNIFIFTECHYFWKLQ